jgi:hypothetical protein
MSRTRVEVRWHLSRDGKWSGRRQAIRDELRSKIIDRHEERYRRRKESHSEIPQKVMCALFSKGYSLEQIRKKLVGRYTTNSVVNNMFRWHPMCAGIGPAAYRANVVGLTGVRDGYVIPVSTFDCEPYFIVELPSLPIYYLSDDLYPGSNYACYGHAWRGGNLVLMENGLYKFSQPPMSSKQDKSPYTDDYTLLYKQKLTLWPNELITEQIREIVNIHLESGMKKCKFEVLGWQNLHYKIDDNMK